MTGLEKQPAQVEENPPHEREDALEGQEITPEKWDDSLSNSGWYEFLVTLKSTWKKEPGKEPTSCS